MGIKSKYIKFKKMFGFKNFFYAVDYYLRRKKMDTEWQKKLVKYEKEFDYIIKKYDNKKTVYENENYKRIFLFWYDGFDTIPSNNVINICVKRIKELYSNEYEIILLDKNNYQQYAKLPEKIVKRFNNKKFGIQSFSDLLRYTLILQNGGIWLDCTLFLTEKIDFEKELANKPFFSMNGKDIYSRFSYKGNHQCAVEFILGGRKNSVIYQFLVDLFSSIHLKHTYRVPYLCATVTLILAQVHHIDDSAIKEAEPINYEFHFLDKNRLEPYSEALMDQCIHTIQKLNWRNRYYEFDDDTLFWGFMKHFNFDKSF